MANLPPLTPVRVTPRAHRATWAREKTALDEPDAPPPEPVPMPKIRREIAELVQQVAAFTERAIELAGKIDVAGIECTDEEWECIRVALEGMDEAFDDFSRRLAASEGAKRG